jgi:hypothetical protein
VFKPVGVASDSLVASGQETSMTEDRSITVAWPETLNEKGKPMLWLGAWLVGSEGVEGDWFHSGRGGGQTSHEIPAEATGVRLRKWPAEGLAPEYADMTPIESSRIDASTLPFERPQPFSLLSFD